MDHRIADGVGIFDLVWCELADVGVCDERNGAEYWRVWYAWLDAGKPSRLAAFITRESNRGSEHGV